MPEVITVSALNHYVKALLDSSEVLFDLALRGEIANFTRNAKSGHCYFSLRDEQCSVKAVMFRSDAQQLGFRPADGMRVTVRCRVSLYERDGAFQVYVSDMFPDGIGSAQMAFEQLKSKLEKEGLFDPAHKKAIPAQPACIGIITSKTGAALQDILQILSRRWPMVKVLLHPATVQGFEAAGEIAAAIDRLDCCGKCDVIIVARGGGSREDLWVFNAEAIARAAYRCKTPLISAIGHEIDFTILDFVADLRAPTPSAAAELAVPDRHTLAGKLEYLEQNIRQNMQKRLQICYNDMERFPLTHFYTLAAAVRDRKYAELNCCRDRAATGAAQLLQVKKRQLAQCAGLADGLSPFAVLARGYTMVESTEGAVLRAEQLVPGQEFLLKGNKSIAHCTVQSQEELCHESTENI